MIILAVDRENASSGASDRQALPDDQRAFSQDAAAQVALERDTIAGFRRGDGLSERAVAARTDSIAWIGERVDHPCAVVADAHRRRGWRDRYCRSVVACRGDHEDSREYNGR